MNCTACSLHAQCRAPVPFSGRTKIGIAVVGEAPGAQEDKVGMPFIGASGGLLWKTLQGFGLERGEVLVCNAVSCYPHGTPTDEHIDACRFNLRDQLAVAEARAVLLLGAVALRSALPSIAAERTVSEVRGTVFRYRARNGKRSYLPTFHPSYILRNRTRTALWKADLQQFVEVARGSA